MSLAAMVLAERGERLTRLYDRWVGVITFGAADRARDAVLAEINPGERLLDVGCGTGTLAVRAAQRGASVVAVDRSPPMLALGRDKARRAGVSVDWRAGDVAFPPVGDERFDVATATFVLSELSRELAALAIRRMAEALRPDGRLVLADEAPPLSPILRLMGALPRALLRVISFAVLQELAPTRRHPWRTLLEEAGLEVSDERAFGSGSLVVLTAARPRDLPPRRHPVRALAEVLPTGVRRGVLRGAAWLDLPIAVTPGVYHLGSPGTGAPVLVTGNFLASVEAVRAGLGDRDAYLAVEDTDGWNVWCAGDAGLFTAEKAAALLELHELARLVERRRIIVPRLGGRVRSRLAALTGWEVAIGPIEARDLPAFLDGGLTPGMRSLDRLYRLRERVRVGALTLIQLPLFLLPLRLLPSPLRRPAWRFALVAGALLPVAHYQLPGRTGIAKGTLLGAAVALAGAATGRLRPSTAVTILATAPLVGWVYQSSSPVVFWKRVWR